MVVVCFPISLSLSLYLSRAFSPRLVVGTAVATLLVGLAGLVGLAKLAELAPV